MQGERGGHLKASWQSNRLGLGNAPIRYQSDVTIKKLCKGVRQVDISTVGIVS